MELAVAPVHRFAPRASTRERPPLRLVGSGRRPAASGRPRGRPPRLSATARCSAPGAGSHLTVEDDLGALLQVSSLPLSPPDNFRRIRRSYPLAPLFLVSGHRSLYPYSFAACYISGCIRCFAFEFNYGEESRRKLPWVLSVLVSCFVVRLSAVGPELDETGEPSIALVLLSIFFATRTRAALPGKKTKKEKKNSKVSSSSTLNSPVNLYEYIL